MLTRFTLGAIAAVLVIAAMPGAAFGRTLVVGDGGPGCRDGRYSTIQAALDVSRPGDQVPVCPGRYREPVRAWTPHVKLYSRQRHAAVIQAPLTRDGTTAVSIGAAGISVRGFTIQPSERTSCDPQDGAISSGTPSAVIDNRITGVGCHEFTDAIRYSGGQPGRFTVDRNDIAGFTGLGVRVEFGDSAVNRNTIRGGRIGVVIVGNASAVQANTVDDASSIGILGDGFDAGDFNLRVAGNRLHRNGTGIRASNFGVGSGGPVRLALRIEANDVLDSVEDGIVVEFSPGFVTRNRSLRSGRFDCLQQFGFATWKDNVGRTDSPSNLCRAP